MSKQKPPQEDDWWIDPPPSTQNDRIPDRSTSFWLPPPVDEEKKTDGIKKAELTEENELDPYAQHPDTWFMERAKRFDKKLWQSILRGGVVKIDPVTIDNVPNEELERARITHLYSLIQKETLAIIGLSLFFVIALPFGAPMYRYHAKIEGQSIDETNQRIMIPLYMPNLTNRAILSWSATSVSEIMTFGFADFETKLLQQKPRFTFSGWSGFVKAFLEKDIGEKFEQHQYVVTTAPSNTPIIVSQGENKRHVYEWHVQVPVVTTYATNNNVTSTNNAVVDLTIVRVPHEHNASGIAIDIWRQHQK